MTTALDLSSQDMERYFDAMALEDENRAISDQEIMEISNNIGYDWTEIGITLGYSYAALEMLEDVYQKQPARRNFVMIKQWYNKISERGYNGRELLAKYFEKARRIDIADSMDVDYTNTVVPEAINKLAQQITFDREHSSLTGTVVLQQLKVDVNIHSHHNVQQTLTLDSPIVLPQIKYGPQILSLEEGSQQKDSCTEKVYSATKEYPGKEKTGRIIEIEKLVHRLSLDKFYPSKLSLQDVRKIRRIKDSVTEADIPWLFLSKILMLNYKDMEKDLDKLYQEKAEFSLDDLDDHLFEDKTASTELNPADIFYVTFLCCNMMLKLEIVSKLFKCRLAIPFIYKEHNDELVLTKWGLRKIFITKRIDEKFFQIDALNNDSKRVTFVRIGNTSLSKSMLLNEILSDQYHPTFFHRYWPLEISIRKVALGIVEAAWYIPSGNRDDRFLELIMFMNLRGNCIDYKEELDMLCKISDVFVVHTDVRELRKEEVRTTLLSIHKANLNVIYALESCLAHDMQQYEILKDYKQSMEHYNHQMKYCNLESIHQTRRSSDIRKDLQKVITGTILGLNVSPLADLIDKLQASDETKIPVCSKGHKNALDVIYQITGILRSEKAKVLPLQGDLWSEWCSTYKTLYRSKSEDDKQKLRKVLENSRSTQRKIFLGKMHSFFNTFIAHFIENANNENTMICYLDWIQSLLDEKSRLILPHFIFNYQKSLMAMKSAEAKYNRTECNKLYKKVEKAEKELTAASFGLEHLIRELGQIYEAMSTKRSSRILRPYNENIAEHFPIIMSKLLQNGHPFEIMDGDNAMVPLIWVTAVLDQLKRDIGDQKILSVSVLGIQSSGKSTLLNAMFGLQFPVSARGCTCTRGVYVQLVKVTNGVLPFSYILVIDTEGLRAHEFSDKTHMHNNELATFVLGLGDITIVNIKGQNTAEMNDVLQIAVHAFLRLKMANGKLRLQQTCIFVHQDMPTVDATSALAYGRQKMIDKLDKMTAEAASQEGLADINSFSQVIEIDPESHTWFFSNLWFGDPPMSPINADYSRQAANVKKHLLFDIAPKRRSFLSISEITSKIGDLWNGILSDDFVFNFRNSLELMAYHMMETKFSKLIWQMDKSLHLFKRSIVVIELARSENDIELDKTASVLTSRLQKHLSAFHAETLNTWNNYTDNNCLREVMVQWQQIRNIQLSEHLSELIQKGKKEINKMATQHKAELVRTGKSKLLERQLQKEAQSLADKPGDCLSPSYILKSFNIIWEKMIGSLEHENVSDLIPVETEIEEILFKHFAADRALISKALVKQIKKSLKHSQMLKFSFPASEIDDCDISISLSLHKEFRPDISETTKCKRQAMSIINLILAKIDSYLSNVTSEDTPFEHTYVKKIFFLLTDTVNEHNMGIKKRTHFQFTTALKVKLAAHITQYIKIVFTEMDNRYEEKHNIKAQMEDLKKIPWKRFLFTVKHSRDEIMLTDMLIDTVQKLLVTEIETCLPFEVVKVIIDECFSTKYSMMLAMMTDLAEKGDFHSFHWYIKDAETFAKEWIKEFTNKRIFGQFIGADCRYVRIVKKMTEKYLKIIQESLDEAKRYFKEGMSTWMFHFEKTLSVHLPIPKGFFSYFVEAKVSNLTTIYKHFSANIKELEQNILKQIICTSQKNVVWVGINPYISIFNKLWGCNHRCPFCGETCQKTSKNHPNENHSCIQHRPPGLKGANKPETEEMAWETCNYYVCSNRTFRCWVSGNKCRESPKCAKLEDTRHKYKDYRIYIPDWEIEPSVVKKSSNYWMWFVYTYWEDLENAYGYKMPSEVLNWSSFEKEDAIRSLQSTETMSHEEDAD